MSNKFVEPEGYKGDEYYIKVAVKHNNEYTKQVLVLGLQSIARKKGLSESRRIWKKYRMGERWHIEPLKEVPPDVDIRSLGSKD